MATFKCKICREKSITIEGLREHLEEEHEDMIPKNFSGGAQYEYYLRTGRDRGSCVECKRETPWNTGTNKYHRFCGRPECKKAYIATADARMIGMYGKVHLLSEPDHQKKMLAGRSISGKYRWSDGTEIQYTGSYELRFLQFLDTFLDFESSDIMSPSPHTYYYQYEGETKFYIPDIFIPSLNLEIEIKDGGDNPNNHHKIQDVDKKKEALKDQVMMSQKQFSYVKVVNNEYGVFFQYLNLLKKQYADNNGERDIDTPIFLLKESIATIDIQYESVKEAANLDNMKPVYILLTYTNTAMAKAIRFFTGDPYSHASISFDSSMKDVYSFGRKHKDGKMTMVNEDIDDGILKDVSDHGKYSLYAIFVPNDQYNLMREKLEEFKSRAKELKFSLVGLVNVALGMETARENEYFCSHFVAEVLKAGDNVNRIIRDTSLYTPYDLAKLKDVKFIARGTLKNYKKHIVDEKVELLKNSALLSSVAESSEALDLIGEHLPDDYVNRESIGRFRSIPGLPLYFKDMKDPVIYFGVTQKEKDAKKINYLTTKRYAIKGANLSLDGLRKFLLDNNLHNEVRYYSKIPITRFYVDTSVEYDESYDFIAVALPFVIKLDKVDRIPY